MPAGSTSIFHDGWFVRPQLGEGSEGLEHRRETYAQPRISHGSTEGVWPLWRRY